MEEAAWELAFSWKLHTPIAIHVLQILKTFVKSLVEAALKAELDTYLGYDKHAATGNNTGNSRNGHGEMGFMRRNEGDI